MKKLLLVIINIIDRVFFGLNETQQIPMPYNYKQFIKKKSFDSIGRISENSLQSFNGAAPTQPIY